MDMNRRPRKDAIDWPTADEIREFTVGQRTLWLVPYRARRTHVVTPWTAEGDAIYREWQELNPAPQTRRGWASHGEVMRSLRLPRSGTNGD